LHKIIKPISNPSTGILFEVGMQSDSLIDFVLDTVTQPSAAMGSISIDFVLDTVTEPSSAAMGSILVEFVQCRYAVTTAVAAAVVPDYPLCSNNLRSRFCRSDCTTRILDTK